MRLTMDMHSFSRDIPLPLRDPAGRVRYTVAGDAYAPMRRLQVLDLSGRQAVSIRQCLPALCPRFELEVYGKPVCTLIRDLRFSPPQYVISSLSWVLRGSVQTYDYALIQAETPIAVCRPDPDQPELLMLELPGENQTERLTALGIMVTVNCI